MQSVRDRAANLTRALRHRDYRLFFAGQLVSLIGTWMQSVAQAWLVYRLSGSAELLGWVTFAGQIPILLLAPVGGAVADRHNRHTIILATQVCSVLPAALLAGLTLTGHVRIWEVFVLASALGTINAFDMPARQSFVTEMVGRADLPNAIALNSSIFNGARLIGPALAGLLVAAVGEGWCFLINAVSFVAVIIGLLAMRRPKTVPEPSQARMLARVREGMAYVAATRPIRALMLLIAVTSVMGTPYAVLMPIFAHRVLGGGPDTLGFLMSCSGLGALAAALILASRNGLSGLGRWVTLACLGFGAALGVFAASHWLWLSAAAMVVSGFCLMLQVGCINTLVQSMVPNAFRGRTMAVHSMMFIGMAPLGALWAGLAAERIGAPATLGIGATACMAAALLFARQLPQFREGARQLVTEARNAETARGAVP